MLSIFKRAEVLRVTYGGTQLQHFPRTAATFDRQAPRLKSRIPSHTAALITQAIGTVGEEIPNEARRLIEARGGFDLRGIQVHVGEEAAAAAKSLRARAFSVSQHIVFGEGEFCPTGEAGLWLLAHEVAHAVRQRDERSQEYFVSAANRVWESRADTFAQFVLYGGNPPQSWMRYLPLVPTALVLRHDGPTEPKCPDPPEWIPISAQREEIWLTANTAIELAYKNSHAGHVMIFGGDFGLGQTITLPRDARLSDIDRRFGNQLLLELKGLMWQLRPDIIDFTERKFYEIKTAEYAGGNTAKVTDQLANYYRIAEAIRVKYGGPQWSQDAPNWYPPHTLPFNSDPDRLVCTSATQYKTAKEFLDTLNRPGLILYTVLEKAGSEEKRKKRAQAMRIVDLAPELAPIRDIYESQLHASLQEADDREYLIVCTSEYVDSVLIPVGRVDIARVLSLLKVPVMNMFENPVVMMRFLGWSIVGLSQYFFIVVAISVLTGPEGAVVGGALGLELIEVPSEIIAGLVAANDVAVLKAASGVLFVIGVAAPWDAQAATIPMSRVGSVRAIPLHSTWGSGTLATGVELDWAGTQYFYLGRASSPT
jgi:Domain of unknown function (DUF4157)